MDATRSADASKGNGEAFRGARGWGVSDRGDTMSRTRTKPLKTGRTEAQVTAAVLDAAKLFGLELERRNVMVAFNPSGQRVRCGTPGEPDYQTTIPAGPNRGRTLGVEIKHSEFDPTRLRGVKADHFGCQLDRMRALNAAGGLSFWVRDGADAARAFRRVATAPGLRVEIDVQGFCVLEWNDGSMEDDT